MQIRGTKCSLFLTALTGSFAPACHFQSIPPWDFPHFFSAALTSVTCTFPSGQLSSCPCETAVAKGKNGCDIRETMTFGPGSVFRVLRPVSSVVQRFQRNILTAVAAGRAGQLRCNPRPRRSVPKYTLYPAGAVVAHAERSAHARFLLFVSPANASVTDHGPARRSSGGADVTLRLRVSHPDIIRWFLQISVGGGE